MDGFHERGRVSHWRRGSDLPVAIRHGAGHHLLLTTAEDRITALHLAGAAPDGGDQLIRQYQYADGHLTTVTSADGQPLSFGYDARGRVTSWTDSNRRRYEYHYDEQDRCIAEGGEDGHVSLRFIYSAADLTSGLRVTTAMARTDPASTETLPFRRRISHRASAVPDGPVNYGQQGVEIRLAIPPQLWCPRWSGRYRAPESPLIPELRARVRFPSPAPHESPRSATWGLLVV
ncbi:RHS repeat domain-containing protein [Streptomyces sioyaensis]|uniref:RHS repeat domain-containing protein n=1 Tax=Streptomyces sioyaensis TaxID=67364 RepID=UPI003798129C